MPNDREDNRKRSKGSPENVVDLTALLRRRREERERFEGGEDLPDEEFPEIPFPEDFGDDEEPDDEEITAIPEGISVVYADDDQPAAE